MVKRLGLTGGLKLFAVTVICVVLVAGAVALWRMGQVAEAAVWCLYLKGWWVVAL